MHVMPARLRTSSSPGSDWQVFEDAASGLSFRYPPSMRVEVRNVPPTEEFDRIGMARWDKSIYLHGDSNLNPDMIRLSFLHRAARKSGTAAPSAPSRQQLRRSCRPMQLPAVEACLCVWQGRAVRSWTVYISAFDWSIRSGDNELSADGDPGTEPPPHDGLFPLLSIIRTVKVRRARR